MHFPSFAHHLKTSPFQVRELETHNLNRKLLGSRKGHVKTFLAWLEDNGAVIEGVEIVDFGEPEGD